jgi:hypothetical protein
MLHKPNNGINASPHHGGEAFWNVFKSCQQSGNLRIVIFAVYGYRGAWDRSSANPMDVSPFRIDPKNTWGIEDVRFTNDEYDDYVSRFCKTHFGKMEAYDAAALQQYVCNTTGRHPGLVSYFMNNIQQKFQQQLKYGGTLKFSEIFLYLKSHSFISMASVSPYRRTMAEITFLYLLFLCCREFVHIQLLCILPTMRSSSATRCSEILLISDRCLTLSKIVWSKRSG